MAYYSKRMTNLIEIEHVNIWKLPERKTQYIALNPDILKISGIVLK